MWPPPQAIPITTTQPKRSRAPSLKATKALSRAAARATVDDLETLNKFVEGLLMGLPRREAALHAGVVTKSPKQLSKKAWQMATTPYVRQTFAELREQIVREKLCTFAEQVLDVKAIAFDQCIGVQGRMLAHALLAKLMGHESAQKIEAKVQAGVMLVPLIGGMDQWEATAQQQQQLLREESK